MSNTKNNALTNNATNAPIVITADLWKRAGITIDTSKDAATIARQNLKDAGAAYIPMGTDSDNLLVIMDGVRTNIDASENARRNACVMLAAIDASGEYRKALNANGKPYSSTLALARDLFPTLEKSTVANFIGAGRSVYLPAINGRFGKTGSRVMLEQTPSNAAVLKGVIADESTRDAALKAVQEAVKKQGKLTKRAAQGIVKGIKNPSNDGGRPDSDRAMERAQTEMSEMDKYNKVLKKILDCIPQTLRDTDSGDIHITIPEQLKGDLKRTLQEAVVSTDAHDAQIVLKALCKAICG